ncbi:hypothetical protein H257_15041 [Aphanomyces astaci]|uniref:Uncharacterized protein n=1 Tax=Aphanomyces astaci TaxID=112090 RepID=W4FP03_APHAT|nr:hypothetical protein H257_15041 [Aphanomyces astaci]ETV69222.1 hypothetical protein H257_15041 [Aphanomyces astaci]|eukprot:XP_009841324.1 hypothetical protein H257_15041 [Aphanomyces astaci]
MVNLAEGSIMVIRRRNGVARCCCSDNVSSSMRFMCCFSALASSAAIARDFRIASASTQNAAMSCTWYSARFSMSMRSKWVNLRTLPRRQCADVPRSTWVMCVCDGARPMGGPVVFGSALPPYATSKR